MFAVFINERDPLRLADLPAAMLTWVQVGGGVAAFGLVLWLLLGLPRWRKEDHDSVPGWQKALFLAAPPLSLVCYALVGILSTSGPGSPPPGLALAAGTAGSARLNLLTVL